jgi:hypothetical protein
VQRMYEANLSFRTPGRGPIRCINEARVYVWSFIHPNHYLRSRGLGAVHLENGDTLQKNISIMLYNCILQVILLERRPKDHPLS